MLPLNILLITSHIQSGEILRSTLDESNLYHVQLAQTGIEALSACAQTAFALVIMDADLKNESLYQLASTLRAIQSEPKLVVIPPDNNPHHPLLADLNPDGFICQPFSAPEVLKTLSHLLEKTDSLSNSESSLPLPPVWLNDPSRVRIAFTQLIASIPAQAGLLIRGEETVCAVGELSPAAAQEITAFFSRFLLANAQTDLARYFHIQSQNSDVLVYAVSIAPGVLLALVYSPATAFTKIRSHSRQLALDLTTHLVSIPPEPLQTTLASPAPTQTIIQPAPSAVISANQAFEAFLNQLPSPEPASEPEMDAGFFFPWELESAQHSSALPDSPSLPAVQSGSEPSLPYSDSDPAVVAYSGSNTLVEPPASPSDLDLVPTNSSPAEMSSAQSQDSSSNVVPFLDMDSSTLFFTLEDTQPVQVRPTHLTSTSDSVSNEPTST